MLEHIKLRIKLIKDDLVLVIVMLAMAIILTMIFGNAFYGKYVPEAEVVDLDSTQASADFISTLTDTAEDFSITGASMDDMSDKLKESNIIAGIVIEQGFSDDYSKVRIVTGKSDVDVMQLQNIVAQSVSLMGNKKNLSKAVSDTLGLDEAAGSEAAQTFDDKYADKTFVTSFRTQGESEWADYNDLMHYVLGFMLFFSTFSMIYVMSDILKEKKQHIFQRNLVTPINRASQLFAKMFVTFLLGFVQISIILLAGKYLFHIHWGGNLGILLLISACYILTFTCLGLFLSSIVKSYDQLGALSPIILVSTAMLGGCMWPIELITNKGLLILSRITPQRWALSAMEAIAMRGDPPSAAIPSILVLLGMSVVYFLLGLRIMKTDLV